MNAYAVLEVEVHDGTDMEVPGHHLFRRHRLKSVVPGLSLGSRERTLCGVIFLLEHISNVHAAHRSRLTVRVIAR